MAPEHEAAAWWGLALNDAVPLQDRLEVALKALDMYSAQMQQLNIKLKGVAELIAAAGAWYDALVELGRYGATDPATEHIAFRSDRWPYEVDLAAAVERLRQQ